MRRGLLVEKDYIPYINNGDAYKFAAVFSPADSCGSD